MNHKISLLVRADLDLDAIDLVATGCLTEQTVQVLLEHIARARMLDPASPVRVDLTAAGHLDPAVVSQLEARLAAPDPLGDRRIPVQMDLPEHLPRCTEAVGIPEGQATTAPHAHEVGQQPRAAHSAAQTSERGFQPPVLAV